MSVNKHSFLLAKSGAILILLGLLSGALVAFAMTGQIDADAGSALAAHLNAIIGGLLLFGVAYTIPMLCYDNKWKSRLSWLMIVGNFANFIITSIKSFLHVLGVGITADSTNNIVYFGLTLFVVLPSIIAAVIWVLGFRKSE